MNSGFSLPRTIAAGAATLSIVLGSGAMAGDAWTMRALVQTALGSYSDSELRDSLSSSGIFLSGDYLEKAGFVIGYNHSEVDGKSSNPEGFASIDENALFLSAKMHRYPDRLPGKLTLRLDTHLIQNEVSSSGQSGTAITNLPVKNGNGPGGQGAGGNQGAGDGQGKSPGQGGVIGSLGTSSDTTISVANPAIAFMNREKSFALDLGYAWSNYDYDDGDEFQTRQLTAGAGLAIFSQANWLQLRGYLIQLSDDEIAAGDADSAAIELKITHWFAPRGPLRLHRAGVTALAGERLLAVDPDAGAVFSLADKQTGSLAINAAWKLGEQTEFMLQFGYDKYENLQIDNDYSNRYIYLNLQRQW